jgi:hypothetical protein
MYAIIDVVLAPLETLPMVKIGLTLQDAIN